MDFNYHNCRLNGGKRTNAKLPAMESLAAVTRAIRIFQETECKSVLDVGSLEGGFAHCFAETVPSVFGVEVRERNFQRCRFLTENGSKAKFIQANAWTIESMESFDGIYCGGLLNHMDRPREFFRLLSQRFNRVLILDTHFATDRPADNLSELCVQNGLLGREYVEFPNDATFKKREDFPLSSWDNRKSFWLHLREFSNLADWFGLTMILQLVEPAGNRGVFVFTKGSAIPPARL